MRRFLFVITLMVIGAVALAQAPAKGKTSSGTAKTSAAPASSGLPSKATVESFMRHMFGWQPSTTWTITAIKPSGAPGIAEVDLNLSGVQNNGERKLYVLPGHKQAITGNMLPFAGEGPQPSDEAINTFVRQMTGGPNPSITWTISQKKPKAVADLTEVVVLMNTPQGHGAVPFLVTPDGKHALIGEPMPFGADPFAATRAKLQRGMNGPSRGPANAPVTIVEFADLQCPACKSALPEVQKLIADAPNAKFVFQQFPLTQMHHWAFTAAEYGQCVYQEDPAAFWKFIDAVYGAQEQITEETNNSEDAGKKAEGKLKQLASQAGANGDKVAACANQASTAEKVKHSVELGKEVEVTGTPTLFVNGRKVSNLGQLSGEQLKNLVAFMAKNK